MKTCFGNEAVSFGFDIPPFLPGFHAAQMGPPLGLIAQRGEFSLQMVPLRPSTTSFARAA